MTNAPSAADISSPLYSCMPSASVDMPDTYSSSESMPALVVVIGDGGASGGEAAEVASLF